MPPGDRARPFIIAGTAAVVVVAWALVFRAGARREDGRAAWSPSAALRGRAVETTEEREKRLAARHGELRDEAGRLRRAVLGDRRPTRGDDVTPGPPALPPEVQISARDTCLQMKLAYPERYAGEDCMSDRYGSVDAWWKRGD